MIGRTSAFSVLCSPPNPNAEGERELGSLEKGFWKHGQRTRLVN